MKDQGAWSFLGALGGEVVPQLLAGGDSQWVERVVEVAKALFVVRDQINTSCLAQQTAHQLLQPAHSIFKNPLHRLSS